MKQTPKLSKSRIQSGRQCHKRLWLELHQPKTVAWTESAQARMVEGTRFGEIARDLLGGGVLIEADHMHVHEALSDTAAALERPAESVPMLFEPAFLHEDVRVRVDAFERHRDYDVLVEVKSTTSVKEEHLWDCAIQTWVARGAGRNVTRIMHGHINNQFVYRVEGDYRGLLKQVDITSGVEPLLPAIPDIVEELKRVAAAPMPAISTGSHCSEPYPCPFLDHCRSMEPAGPEFPIDLLPRAGALIDRLAAAGYRDLREVPVDELTNATHRRVAEATRSGSTFVSDELPDILDAIPYPRYYVDFETISFVVPRWFGTRPFQQLPFQFSCHVEKRDGTLRHEAFLDVTGDSPLHGFVENLLRVLKSRGAVLVWSQGFEGACLRELAEMFPQHAPALLAIIERMVDLLPIYRNHYYHRDMQGSWSIKAVLPTIAPDLDYADLGVGDGSTAQAAYREAVDTETSTERRAELRDQLLAYCERDTLAMVRLANWRPRTCRAYPRSATPKSGKRV